MRYCFYIVTDYKVFIFSNRIIGFEELSKIISIKSKYSVLIHCSPIIFGIVRILISNAVF